MPSNPLIDQNPSKKELESSQILDDNIEGFSQYHESQKSQEEVELSQEYQIQHTNVQLFTPEE